MQQFTDRIHREQDEAHGHHAGEALLVEVGRHLSAMVRSQDVVARLGVDEFVIHASRLQQPTDAAIMNTNYVQVFMRPIEVDGRLLKVRLSVGYAIAWRADSDEVERLVAFADRALHEAKRNGKECYRRAQPSNGTSRRATPLTEKAEHTLLG